MRCVGRGHIMSLENVEQAAKGNVYICEIAVVMAIVELVLPRVMK